MTFPKEKIVHHGRPSWLNPQHLDIFLPIRNIGIEFQGRQHTEPIEFFGGEEALQKRKKLDLKKKMLCSRNGCKLILVYDGYDFDEIKDEVARQIQESNWDTTKRIGRMGWPSMYPTLFSHGNSGHFGRYRRKKETFLIEMKSHHYNEMVPKWLRKRGIRDRGEFQSHSERSIERICPIQLYIIPITMELSLLLRRMNSHSQHYAFAPNLQSKISFVWRKYIQILQMLIHCGGQSLTASSFQI